MDFLDQMPKYHPPEEPQRGLSMDVSFDAVKQEPIGQSVDCNVGADALHNAHYNRHEAATASSENKPIYSHKSQLMMVKMLKRYFLVQISIFLSSAAQNILRPR